MVLKLSCACERPRNITKIQILTQGQGWGLRLYISDKFSADSEAAQFEQRNSSELVRKAEEEFIHSWGKMPACSGCLNMGLLSFPKEKIMESMNWKGSFEMI